MSSTTARDIALDADGDIEVTLGDLRLVRGLDAIAQSLAIRLQFYKGEWFLDEEAGTPLYQDVLVKNPSPTLLQSIFRERILGTKGVTSILKLDLELDTATRRLTVSGSAMTDLGLLDFTETV